MNICDTYYEWDDQIRLTTEAVLRAERPNSLEELFDRVIGLIECAPRDDEEWVRRAKFVIALTVMMKQPFPDDNR